MMPMRFGSASPDLTTASTQSLMSLTPSKRSAPLSRLTNVFPNPEDPRTFGAKTAMPRERSAW